MPARKLGGIFTPNMVPLDDDGRINEPEFRRLIDWLIERGISGLYPNGSTGEFTRFSFEERKRIVRIVAEQSAGRTMILAGAAESDVRTTLEAAACYHELGCDAVAIVSPFYYRLSQEAIYAYFSEIARHSPIPLTLYNIPQFANDITNETIRRLAAEQPMIVGIKDSSRDLPRFLNMMHDIRPVRPDFVFLTGCEEMLLPALMMGADGGTIATSGVVPEVVVRLYRLARAGRFEEAREVQYSLLELIRLIIFGADFPEAVRAAIEIRGFRMGRGRMPLSATSTLNLEAIRRTIHCVLSAHGVVDPPPGGCPPDQPLLTAAVIEQIVREVSSRLSRQDR